MTTDTRQIVDPEVLEALFASAARVAVLKVFAIDPARSYYQRQIEAVTGLAIRGVQRELERLESIQLVFPHREGNRVYYQVDVEHPLFSDLRSMLLKSANDDERLRADLAADPSIRIALFDPKKKRLVIVGTPGAEKRPKEIGAIRAEFISNEAFAQQLSREPDALRETITGCVDMLGRRDDVIWRRLEAAGIDIEKGDGVP